MLAVATLVGYLAVLRQQGGDPAAWFLALVVLGAVAAGYACLRRARHRRPALVAAAALLTPAGLLGILSVGLPLLLAGGLCLVALARSPAAAGAAA